ncbi:sulfotransferase domain-containing protein [Fictibacillus barbaricus]|nr:sulfotransferase domain-containing protein [Fictibacillus barbaricus]
MKLAPFFFNSFPKSGTHLMFQILTGLPSVKHDQLLHLYEGFPYQFTHHEQALRGIKENEFISGHIYYSKSWEDKLKELNMKQIFLYRDLRDIIVSYNHYVEKVDAPLFHVFREQNLSQKERLLAIINGVESSSFNHPGIKEWFSFFINWMHIPHVLSVRFEDLISNEQSQTKTLSTIIKYLYNDHLPLPIDQMLSSIKRNIDPSQSATFRKGKIGSWQEEFDQELKDAFKRSTGDLLIQLGYEQNNNW